MNIKLLLLLLAAPQVIFSAPRPAAAAGGFYPSGRNELIAAVDRFLAQAPLTPLKSRAIAILVPHAGYEYSGQVAASAYKTVNSRGINTVIVIGNSHHFLLKKGAVYPSGSFATPLGSVEIDSELASRILARTGLLRADKEPHDPEHSIEVQLPFLQRVLPEFKIVPILLSSMTLEDTEKIAGAIAASLKELGLSKTTLLIASSDLSHYPGYADAVISDSKALSAITAMDPPLLQKQIFSIEGSAAPKLECVLCARESVYTVLYTAKMLGADSAKVLSRANSGDITGGRDKVVGYAAAVFFSSRGQRPEITKSKPSDSYTVNKAQSCDYRQTPKKELKKEQKMTGFSVSPQGQKELLAAARYSIERTLETGKTPRINSKTEELKKPAAVFVTLNEQGSLRGCIGTTAPREPLIDAVTQMAAAAAFEDPRFNRVSAGELKDIKIEISVLSPMQRVKDAGEIKENIHGVMVKKGPRSGLFLPQVWEHFNRKEDFLNELCSQKAGLEADAWKKPETELYIFTVFAFEE